MLIHIYYIRLKYIKFIAGTLLEYKEQHYHKQLLIPETNLLKYKYTNHILSIILRFN